MIGTSIGSAVMIYEIIAVFGYLTFGSKVSGHWNATAVSLTFPPPRQVGPNIIAMYPTTSLFIAVGQVAIAILVMFSYPLQVHPCRNCLDKVFHAGQLVKPVIGIDDDDDDDEEPEDEHHASHDMTPLKHTALTIAIVAGGFSIAYFVDDLKMGELATKCYGINSSCLRRRQCCRSSVLLGQQPSRLFYQAFSGGRSVLAYSRTSHSG